MFIRDGWSWRICVEGVQHGGYVDLVKSISAAPDTNAVVRVFTSWEVCVVVSGCGQLRAANLDGGVVSDRNTHDHHSRIATLSDRIHGGAG